MKKKKTNNDKKISENKKIKINKPLSGSFANVCTEFKMPDLTKKYHTYLGKSRNR